MKLEIITVGTELLNGHKSDAHTAWLGRQLSLLNLEPRFSTSISDERTVAGVREFWNNFQLLLEPHGSVAWQGFQDWIAVEPLGTTQFPFSTAQLTAPTGGVAGVVPKSAK